MHADPALVAIVIDEFDPMLTGEVTVSTPAPSGASAAGGTALGSGESSNVLDEAGRAIFLGLDLSVIKT